MSICIYGEIALDILLSSNKNIRFRKGGAGLYASLSAAKVSNKKINLLTILGPEIEPYDLAIWSRLGVSFSNSKKSTNYNISKYLVTGFENYGIKKSIPLETIKRNDIYNPDIPEDTEAILLLPINHSIPKELCRKAREVGATIFVDPKPNADSISDTKYLLEDIDVLLVNEEELFLLSLNNEIYNSISLLLEQGLKYIIVKRGIKGCIVAECGKKPINIPAFKSNAVCTLGSGDVFDGALISMYMETNNMEYSARFASFMAGLFIEEFEIEHMPSQLLVEEYLNKDDSFTYGDLREITVYLAGPFFSQQELLWVEYICEILEQRGLKVLSPSRENGIINPKTSQMERESIFNLDIEMINKSDVIIALLDSDDMGTSFEIGYSYSIKKPVIGLDTSGGVVNNMIRYGCDAICNNIEELISEVHRYARKL